MYAALVVPQLGRPLVYDEVDFARAATSVAAPGEGGLLRYDRGYIADFPAAPDAGQRLQLALWHPPGYLLLLGAWKRLLPDAGDWTLHVTGAACGLLTLLGTAALGRAVGGALAGALAALLWATSPYAVQSALLLDIDGSVLPPLVLLLAGLTLSPGHSRRRGVALAVTFGALLWCKLTTGPLVATLLLIWLSFTGQRAVAVRAGGSFLAGAAGAVATWLLFATAAGLPPERPVRDLVEALRQLGAFPLPLVYAVGALRAGQWLHPLTVALCVAAPLALHRATPGAVLLFAGGGAALFSLGKLAAGYPKYLAGAWPLLAVAGGVALSIWLSRPGAGATVDAPRPGDAPRRARLAWLAGAALVAGVALTLITGPDALIRAADLRLLALWLAIGAALLALAAPLGGAVPAALTLGLLLGANLTTATYHKALAHSTSYLYGATGQEEAGRWLRVALEGGVARGLGALPVAVADREVAYYAGNVHFVDSERWIDARRGRGLEGAPVAGVRLVVSRDPRVADLLPGGFVPVGRFGDYTAWRGDCDEDDGKGIPCSCFAPCGGS